MSGKILIAIGLIVAVAAAAVWWFGRSERCLAREPRGYWAFSAPELDPRSHCVRMSSRMVPL